LGQTGKQVTIGGGGGVAVHEHKVSGEGPVTESEPGVSRKPKLPWEKKEKWETFNNP